MKIALSLNHPGFIDRLLIDDLSLKTFVPNH